MNERQIFVLDRLRKVHELNNSLLIAHLDAIHIAKLSFVLHGNALQKSPWKVRHFYNMFLEKRKIDKEQKRVVEIFTERVQLRHKIANYRLHIDLAYMEKALAKMVKRERFEEAAELRDKILLIKNDTVYGHDYTSNNTRQTV